jgi:hypothetical protein
LPPRRIDVVCFSVHLSNSTDLCRTAEDDQFPIAVVGSVNDKEVVVMALTERS